MREGLLGWSTNALVQLDDEVPGVLARVLTAAAPRKQAIFAALAAREEKVGVFEGADDLFERSFAEVVRHGRASDILRRAFGAVPDGLPGLLAQVAESTKHVRAYVKNHNLGLEVPYLMGSEPKKYRPDFIVQIDDGSPDPLNLIVETKGYRGEDAIAKANTMNAYWVPGVNNLGKFGRWAFVEYAAVYEMEAAFKKLVDDVRSATLVEEPA